MDSKGGEKQEVDSSYIFNEKLNNETSEKYLPDNKTATDYDDDKNDEIKTFGGDTALANAPWKYKIIALVTALMFPCKYIY